ncbi:hypothetical protein CH063_15152 [Colletotrichum higginsianum]|uniref:Uncharacterized protein n=1 Tax=Colletotrichum higginsianum (strain IMI 349063) TaxID=759273 RepID=H1W1L7_COLHI|nr:hypothetical protein CH063_15152 [Colletotrichum higginsianum]
MTLPTLLDYVGADVLLLWEFVRPKTPLNFLIITFIVPCNLRERFVPDHQEEDGCAESEQICLDIGMVCGLSRAVVLSLLLRATL